MALITANDIMTYMDITFSNVQEDAAEMVIDGLQSELEAYLRRPVEQQSFTESYRVPDIGRGVPSNAFLYNYNSVGYASPSEYYVQTPGISYIPPYTVYLDNSPVNSVTSVTVTRPFISATPQAKVADVDYIVRDYGIDLLDTYPNDLVDVTYNAGLDGSNIKVFKLLMLRAAAREMQNMHDDVVGLKDLTTRNVAPLDTGFTDRELMSIKKYRRVRVA